MNFIVTLCSISIKLLSAAQIPSLSSSFSSETWSLLILQVKDG